MLLVAHKTEDTKFLINLRKEQNSKFFGQSLHIKSVLGYVFILVWDYKNCVWA